MAELALAQQVAEFAAASTFDRLPPEVIDSVRHRVLDVLGVCAAATSLPTSHSARAWVREQGGAAQARAVGLDRRVPASQAAFVNGVLAHSLDYDDTHLPSVLHPSASVVPAALAAAEASGSSGRETIAAIAVGLDVCVRLGMAGYDATTQSSVFFEHGQHATSICGAMGGAVAAALLYGLDTDGLTNSLGLAASMAAGVIEANRTGGTVKRMHCGWAAHAAISAAQLVRYGFTGPPTVLEGRFGFFQAWLHGQFDPSAVTSGLGEVWSVPGIFFKPYPANHFTHTAIDAAAQLRVRGLHADDVESAVLGVAAPTVRTIGQPIEVKRAPDTGYMAQFSGPYAVVVGLLGGTGLGAGLDDYTDELARDPRRRELMRRIDVIADEECTAAFPHQFACRLRVRTRSGEALEAAVMTNWGGPDRPLSYEQLVTKFRDNARRSLAEPDIKRIENAVAGMAELTDVGELVEPLTTAGAAPGA